MIIEKTKNSCTGCTACVNICPTKSISMKHDVQGFLYPSIDIDTCIRCNACEEVCNESSSRGLSSIQKGFGAVAKNKELQMLSSSGGVFSLLCNEMFANNGIVFGVTMTDNNRSSRHIAIYSKDDIACLRGAKYLQSDPGDSFSKVGELLDSGKDVLFSGTPCQVDGLKAFINGNDEKLLCVDMICHGVPSPLIWKKYCDEIEKKYKGTIDTVNFRYKKYSWEKPFATVKDKDSKIVFHSKKEDPYMRLFLSDYTLRPSCYECQHKGISRKSDITIADFWGVDKIVSGLSNGAGTSLVIIHTEKGLRYFDKIKDHINSIEVDITKSIEYNGAAIKPAKKPVRLDDFWTDSECKTIELLADKYAPMERNDSIKERLKHSPIFGLVKKNKKVNMESGICFVIDL